MFSTESYYVVSLGDWCGLTTGATNQAKTPLKQKLLKRHSNKSNKSLLRIKKSLTCKGLSLIIMMSVLTGCGMMKSSEPLTRSCVDMTTYVNNGKTAAQVISKERICEKARLNQI